MGDPSFTDAPAHADGGLEIVPQGDINLQVLAAQLSNIAGQLRTGSVNQDSAPARFGAPVAVPFPDPRSDTERQAMRLVYAELARDLYVARRKRESIFGDGELFGEPAWDILLDLYVAYVERKKVSVSSACIGSAAPSTTGLRWLGILSEQELVTREHDPEDQRRVLVRLSEKGLKAMDTYFASAAATA
uniref:winged helix DNA-binding protein n=1 Tax=uncultured Erythrobacter sp. TaxID=263913 RepID=UPI002621CBCA|nr:winged helix DNA-binding protein [uncultured Erythrobacter sp.]